MIRDKKKKTDQNSLHLSAKSETYTWKKKIKFSIAKDFKHLVSNTLKKQFKKFSCALP